MTFSFQQKITNDIKSMQKLYFLINFIKSDCVSGFYGDSCQNTCGKCKADASCNTTSGVCPDGCQDHWILPNCTSNTKCTF